MVQIINPVDLFELCKSLPVIDVRAPSEYLQGHIPGAANIPLFDDEERKHVGTIYKQQSREAAIMTGLDYAGKKLTHYVKLAKGIAPEQRVVLHCWRGGMRSESMAWLLSLAGFDVFLLRGGYKAFRRAISNQWENHGPVFVLSGKTGTGKTEILHQMVQMDQQILDLEHFAHHKGSAFGGIGHPPQPTNEQFENNLGISWMQLIPERPVWIEDESRTIGTAFIPERLFSRLIHGTVIYLEMPKSLRIQRLVHEYAGFQKELLVSGIEKIQRKLGGQHAKASIDAVEKDDFETAADIILNYYDKSYGYNLLHRDSSNIHTIQTNTPDARDNAMLILEYCNNQLFSFPTF